MASLRCSVGEKLNEQCFLTRSVKNENYSIRTLDGIDANLVRTIQYRTSMDFVPTICDHHYAAYGSCFNQHVHRSKRCGDLFDCHKEKIPVVVKVISQVISHVRSVSKQTRYCELFIPRI